jgi:putative intracellular protease/amidase
MGQPRILIVTTSNASMGGGKPTGLWLEELTTPYFVFVEAGARVTLASIKGGIIPVDPGSIEPGDAEPESVARFRADATAMAALDQSHALAALDGDSFDAIFLPGGHGTMWDLPCNATLAALVGKMWRDGKVVGAVCHGPAGLLSAVETDGEPLVMGKAITAFTDAEERAAGLDAEVPFLLESRLRELGALFENGEPFAPYAIADGRLVTGQNPASSQATAQLVLDAVEATATVW